MAAPAADPAPHEAPAALQAQMGVRFANPALLRQALVHRSLINEADLAPTDSNERLEFLGDAVLGLVTTELLFQRHPDYDEGELTRARASLVNLNAAAGFAKTLDLGAHLMLGRGAEMTGARKRSSVLGRAFEALIGAVYLDAGLEAARDFITPFVSDALGARGRAGPQKDYKTQLQERLHVERAATRSTSSSTRAGLTMTAASAWPSRSTTSSWRRAKDRASSGPSRTRRAPRFAN